MPGQGRARIIEESGGRLIVLKMAGEGATSGEIARRLRDEGVCDVQPQAVRNYISRLAEDPGMRQAMELAAKRFVQESGDVVVTGVWNQLRRFREIVGKLLEQFEDAQDGEVGFLARGEGETERQHLARIKAFESAVENLPKLDRRLEAWITMMGNVQGVEVFQKGLLSDPRNADRSGVQVTVNVETKVMQYQQVMIDFLPRLSEGDREEFKRKLAQIGAEVKA